MRTAVLNIGHLERLTESFQPIMLTIIIHKWRKPGTVLNLPRREHQHLVQEVPKEAEHVKNQRAHLSQARS